MKESNIDTTKYEITENEFNNNISDYWEKKKEDQAPFSGDDKENLKSLIKHLKKVTTDFSKTTFDKGRQILLSFYKSNKNAPDSFRIYKTTKYYFLIEKVFNDDLRKFYKFDNLNDLIKFIKNKFV